MRRKLLGFALAVGMTACGCGDESKPTLPDKPLTPPVQGDEPGGDSGQQSE